VRVVEDPIWPGAGVIFEADPYIDLRVVVLAGLDDLRAVFFERFGGFLGRAHDGDVSGDMPVGILINHQHKPALICKALGFAHFADPAPTRFSACLAREPIGLGVGEKLLTVLGRAQEIDAETLCGGGRECAAVGVVAGALVVCAAVRFSRLPIDMFMGQPQ